MRHKIYPVYAEACRLLHWIIALTIYMSSKYCIVEYSLFCHYTFPDVRARLIVNVSCRNCAASQYLLLSQFVPESEIVRLVVALIESVERALVESRAR